MLLLLFVADSLADYQTASPRSYRSGDLFGSGTLVTRAYSFDVVVVKFPRYANLEVKN